MTHLTLDQKSIIKIRKSAKNIASVVDDFVQIHSTTSIERAVLRLYGVDGVDLSGVPLPNKLVDILQTKGKLESGASYHFAASMLESKRDAKTTAELIDQGKISFGESSSFSVEQILKQEQVLTNFAINTLDNTRKRKLDKQKQFPLPEAPWKYLIVATGNIYEDRVQADAAVRSGADVIAVIRSTAQSLLDYVPYGATKEGFGGTFATQENFKIMRQALDKSMQTHGRYVSLVNYSSGLCMAEIAASAAIEDLDMLLNDSMYGILFRDINMQRTFIDQYFSRLICARANIIINTGEDNYLTTADAIEGAHTVTASQLINEAMGKVAMLTDEQMGLGHAFEIDPQVENGFLLELAHASLAKALFPNSPLKYMPPTKHKSTDVFYSHVLDAMFNLASITTKQGIHLAGILTEAIHTPFMQDRAKALNNINYIFNTAKNLGDEIEFKKGGLIEQRAGQVLKEVVAFLSDIENVGLMKAISQGKFANIKREIKAGKGLDGVFKKGPNYSNPIIEAIKNNRSCS